MATKDVIVKEWADYEYRKLIRSTKFLTDKMLIESLKEMNIPVKNKRDAIYVG